METKRRGTTRSASRGLKGRLKPLQWFSCRSCGKSFTLGRRGAWPRAGFAEDAVREAIRIYVEGLSSYRTRAGRRRRLWGSRVGRLVDLIDHILLSEVPATRGVGSGDMKALYQAVSSPMRYLLEVVTEAMNAIVQQARVTHEVANTVEMLWESDNVESPQPATRS